MRPSAYAPAVLAAALSALPAAVPAADTPAAEAPTPVVAIVRVAKPWYATRSAVVGKMRDTIPQYARLPGLMFKAFSFEQASGDFGGVYHWRSRAEAQAWFSAGWFERVRRERGVEGQLRYFDAPLSLDNRPGGPAATTESPAVVTLVEVAAPPGLTRERLLAGFAAAVPAHRAAPGLLRKHFIISDNNTFGGVYLWQDEASARAWFNADWHARVRQTYGSDARIEWFDTPILLPTQDPANTLPAQAMMLAAP
jgi:heme-degrading monooxygenase HmoA